jgi:hypothetical protein
LICDGLLKYIIKGGGLDIKGPVCYKSINPVAGDPAGDGPIVQITLEE